MRSRTHRAAAALRARSARVPPPQQREGIGPTPTHRRNHTPTRPQHVHTGRREGREATGGYAHRCEVVALLVASLALARTCRARTCGGNAHVVTLTQPPSASLSPPLPPRAQGRRGSTARACRPYTPNRPHTARVSSRPVPADQLGRREPLRVATHRRLAPLGARCRRVPAAPRRECETCGGTEVMEHAEGRGTAKTRVPGDGRAQESPYHEWARLVTPPSRALAPRALKAGGRDQAVLRRLAARGGEQPALSARGLPEHTARGSGGRV